MNTVSNRSSPIPIPHTRYLIPVIFLLFITMSPLARSAASLPISGQFKFSGKAAHHESDSIFSLAGDGTYIDGQADIRLKNTFYFSEWGYILAHYEAVLAGGDTRRKTNELLDLIGIPGTSGILPFNQVEDDRRLMDLTHVITDEEGHIGYHRLDRLALGIRHQRGAVIIGRQAQTWGNGMIFNPMDLFNPFSPTDIHRDYKIGDDMVSALFPTGASGDFQILYVPRRDAGHDIKWDESSIAAKWHIGTNGVELDIMGARHYEDIVIGMGSTGYVGNAAWRMDGTWTFLKNDPDVIGEKDGFFAIVANVDYSWILKGKNFYGFLEFYHNGLGRSEYIDAFFDKHIMDRISRGELFTLGKNYLSALVQCELHPLFNVYCTLIENLGDPSGIMMPRAVWDAAENLQITIGATLFTGKEGTEYGGIAIPFTNLYFKQADNLFIWITKYF